MNNRACISGPNSMSNERLCMEPIEFEISNAKTLSEYDFLRFEVQLLDYEWPVGGFVPIRE